jgi:phosphatidylserine decarboxylase
LEYPLFFDRTRKNMFEWFHTNLIWTAGAQILLILIALGIAGFLFCRPFMYAVLAFMVFTFYFFRNPERICLQAVHDPAVVVCPADGKVVDIQYSPTSDIEGFMHKVSIFLSPFDVHVNWAPAHGVVTDVCYKEGEFAFAFVPKSSLLNERNDIYIRAAYNDKTLIVRQIAGTVARRICCWVKPGQEVQCGAKVGMIRFGSRVDVLLPAGIELMVGLGQRVYGGQTVLGRWKD